MDKIKGCEGTLVYYVLGESLVYRVDFVIQTSQIEYIKLQQTLLDRGIGEAATPYPGLLHFTLDPYLIMLSAKQGGIKYHFLSLWYDST